MTEAIDLIAKCRDFGVALAPGPGGKLRLSPPGKLPEELRGELRRRKAEVLAVLLVEKAEEIGKPDYRSLYQELSSNPLFDDFPVIDAWLADNHPGLWQRLRQLDDELTGMEGQGADGTVYQQKLEELFQACQESCRLYAGRKKVRVWFQ